MASRLLDMYFILMKFLFYFLITRNETYVCVKSLV